MTPGGHHKKTRVSAGLSRTGPVQGGRVSYHYHLAKWTTNSDSPCPDMARTHQSLRRNQALMIGRIGDNLHSRRDAESCHAFPVNTLASQSSLSAASYGGSRPGWGSLVILGDCGSLNPSSNLGPGPPCRFKLIADETSFSIRRLTLHRL